LTLDFSPVKRFDFAWQPVAEAQWYELFERADAQSEYVQIASDLTGEALSSIMPLHLRADAGYELWACNDAGCTASDPLDVTSDMAAAVGYFTSSNFQLGMFGTSVALSGDGATLAVAAINESGGTTGINGDQTDLSASESGAVYVFGRDESNGWSQQAYIKASNTDADDAFGLTMAISGDGSILAVGTSYEDSAATSINGNAADDSAAQAGAVYVFERDATGTWAQAAYVKAFNADANDAFGESLALAADGQTLAVGAINEASGGVGLNADPSDNSSGGTGAVYVFHRDDSSGWTQQAYIKASNAEADDYFGRSVALSGDGNLLAAGADQESSAATGLDGDQSDNSNPAAGAVYLFQRTGTTWAQQQYIKPGGGWNGHFGSDLAMSHAGDVLLIGDAFTEITVMRRAGPNAWGDRWGFTGAVAALSGDGLTVAAARRSDDGDAVGVHGPDDIPAPVEPAPDAGAVDVYVWDGESWVNRATVKASNTDAGDRFGTSVSLSFDGTSLAVGAPNEASNARGVGGDQSDNSFGPAGATYLY
jgi:hypothetical protein